MSGDWLRVNRERRCPVCGRADWCLIAADGAAALCPRVESARRVGGAGWLHRMTGLSEHRSVRSVFISTSTARPDLSRLADDYLHSLDPGRLHQLAGSLGLSTDSLLSLGIGWSMVHRAWSFPMRDAAGTVVGIRLRRLDGSKFAVKGGREGLFFPTSAPVERPLLVCEGPTDVAALLDMGLRNVVGRPSCTGGIKLLVELMQRCGLPEVVIVADGDEPGRGGAANLASQLVAYSPAVSVIQPPHGIKDVRDWLRAGGTRADVERAITAAPVRRLIIRTMKRGGEIDG